MKMRSYYLGELTWPDVKDFLTEHDVAIVPVGSCEQHGPHLPIDTDAYDAFWLSLKASEKAQCAIVALPLNYGVSLHHMDFPGTVTLSPHTLEQVAYEVVYSLTKHGFKKILFENGHGGNTPALEAAVQRIKADTNAFVVIVGVPIQEMRDQNNVAIKYVTANITFYEGTAGLRCIISNRINYYPDGTFIKPNMPKRNVSIKQYVLLMKLYEAIR